MAIVHRCCLLDDRTTRVRLHGEYDGEGASIGLYVDEDEQEADPFYGMSITEEDIIYLLRCSIHYEDSRECLALYC